IGTISFADERSNIFVQIAHSNPVTTITSSADGKLMLSGDAITVKLWEVATGREIRTFWGESKGALSPNGKYVLLAGKKENSLRLFDIDSGLGRTFKGHAGVVYDVAFSQDGKLALSASSDKTIRVWDISTMTEIRSFVPQSEPFKAFSSDGNYFVTGTNETEQAENYPFTIWDIATGTAKHFKGGAYPVKTVAVSSDGKLVLTGLIFDKKTAGRKLKERNKKDAGAKEDDLLLLWDTASGALIKSFKGLTDNVNSVAISHDGRYAVSGGQSLWGDVRTLKLWDIATGSVVWSKDPSIVLFSVMFSPDGKYVYCDSYDLTKGTGKTIRMWNVSTGAEIKVFSGLINSVRSVAFSPDGKEAFLETEDKSLNLWDITTGSVVRSFTGYDKTLFALAPDGKSVLIGGELVTNLKYTEAG
ncbi:MAG TPA: WD40 repeat domain-containing protein, partial [Bdellovibrio sp.]|nr:WD40 repeat domain-containing protein [Bdellovibrio sp.]